MPYIKVNTNKISRYSNDINSVYTRVNRIKSEFASIGYSLDWDINSASGINNRIKTIENELSAERSCLSKMKSFLSSSVTKYNNVENRINEDKRKKDIQTPRKDIPVVNISNDANDIVEIMDVKTDSSSSNINSVKANWFDNYLKYIEGSSSIGDFLSAICDKFQGLARIPQLNKLLDSISGSSIAVPIISLYLSAPGLASSILELYKEIRSGGNFFDEIFGTGGATIKFSGAASQVATIGNKTAITKLAPILIYLNIAASGFDFASKSIETYDKLASDGCVDMGDWGEIGIRSSIKGLDTLFCFGLLNEDSVSDNIINWADETGKNIGEAYLKAKEFFPNLF